MDLLDPQVVDKLRKIAKNKQKKYPVRDYHFCSNMSTPKEERDRLNIGDVWINGAVCLKCNEFVRSRNRHDFRRCKCGAVAVDGGSHYCKRVGNPEDYINVIEGFGENVYD